MARTEEDIRYKQLFCVHGKLNEIEGTIMVDSGSQENVISEKFVKNHSISNSKHPKPYQMSWLQTYKHINFDERAKIILSVMFCQWMHARCFLATHCNMMPMRFMMIVTTLYRYIIKN